MVDPGIYPLPNDSHTKKKYICPKTIHFAIPNLTSQQAAQSQKFAKVWSVEGYVKVKGAWELYLTNVLRPGSVWSSELRYKLEGIESDLNQIVQESKEWSQGKCSHKDGSKTKLDNFEENKKHELCVIQSNVYQHTCNICRVAWRPHYCALTLLHRPLSIMKLLGKIHVPKVITILQLLQTERTATWHHPWL